MCDVKPNVIEEYTAYYTKKNYTQIYPSEWVVRTFLADYPRLNMKKPQTGDVVIDVSCGDGRNLLFLARQGYKAFGTEISSEIAAAAKERVFNNGFNAEVRVGNNTNLPFGDSFADYALAAYCMYYCNSGDTFAAISAEYARVIKPGGYIIAAVLSADSPLVSKSECVSDCLYVVRKDEYGLRNGYRLFAASDEKDVTDAMGKFFTDFSFGREINDFYGFENNLYWVTARRI
ncbi:hypothetical protein AGMMS49975_00270 [Clostridia bacterium]|nr:hypothetical protein AGMMS49975_00270 [Clostridia bacterium]